MAATDTINVNLNLNNELGTAGKVINEAQKSGKMTSAQAQTSRNQIQAAQNLLNSGIKSREELDQLNRILSSLFRSLERVAMSMTTLSPEAQKLKNEYDKAAEAVKQQRQKISELTKRENIGISTRKDKNGQTVKGYTDTSIYGQYEKNGHIRTNMTAYQDINALKNAYDNGKSFVLKDQNGNVTAQGDEARAQVKQIIDGYIEEQTKLNTTITTARTELDQMTTAETNAKDALTNQMSKDAAEGKGGINPALGEVLNAETSTRGKTGQLQSYFDEQESSNRKSTNVALTADVEDTTRSLNNQTGAVGRAVKQFTIYSLVINNIRKVLRSTISTITELDKNLTEQAMVTGRTRKQTYALLESYQAIASQTGATTKEVAEVSTQFLRQGKTAQEALTLTQAAISAAKVAGISATDSVNYLTTALNGFSLSASEAMNVSDKFAAIAASSATSYDEIATALSKVASQASLAGMSIDYTTALLAKGLETTREAPETMGTALKTVIARMREMTDYGETLEGDTDVNNVETQLAYVGIALKEDNGELRSTEDVLDDLGKKWDTLNSNQQAAVAKALAGTRQQSRLIAMMSDYERVTELQEIAQRSEGATLAQMSTYMEGMSAATNKVKVAWEEIVSSISNSDAIISVINNFANVLDWIGQILETTAGQFSVYTSIAIISTSLLASAMARQEIQKSINRSKLEEQKTDLQDQKVEQEKKLLSLQAYRNSLNQLGTDQKSYAVELRKLAAKAKENGNEALAARYEAMALAADQESLDVEAQKVKADKEIQTAKQEIGLTNIKIAKTDVQIANNASGLAGTLTSMVSGPLTTGLTIAMGIMTVLKTVNAQKAIGIALTKKQTYATVKSSIAEKEHAGWSMAGSAGKIPYVGWAIAIAILAAIGIGLAVATSQLDTTNKAADEASEGIDELSNEIYNLNKEATAINNTIDEFDELDSKILKTKEDTEAMTEALEEAADSLSSDEDDNVISGLGESEQEFYNNLQTNRAKRDFLQQVSDAAEAQIQQDYKDTLKKLNSVSKSTLNTLLSDAEYANVQDAIYAMNNNTLYQYLDSLEDISDDTKSAVESVTQAILEELDATDALAYANSTGNIQQLVNTLKDLTMIAGDDNEVTTLAEVLDSDDYTVLEKVEAYKTMNEALTGNAEALDAFNSLYSEYNVFAEMGTDVLNFIEDAGLSVDKLNDLYSAYETLQKRGLNITEEEWKSQYSSLLRATTETSGDVGKTIDSVFGIYLSQFEKNSEEWQDAYNAFVDVLDSALGTTMLNIGQNIDKVTNSIEAFYEKATEWNSLSETEKTEFMSTYSDIFADGGEELYNAIQSGNYELIKSALMNNDTLADNVQDQLDEINQQLAIEEARIGDERDEAYIKYLKQQKKYFENIDELWSASLETRLDQEQNQLDIYKEYLEKQQEELEDSLEKRKEAYEDYFDAINETADDEDYEEQVETLLTNLNRISSTTDATSNKTRKELEDQLKDLEKERVDTLRERAQDAILENLDKTLDDINDKFDSLLDDQQLLLSTMQDAFGSSNSTALLQAILQANTADMTALQAQDYIQNTLQPAFGDSFAGIDLNDITVASDENNNLILQLGTETINMTEDSKSTLRTTIIQALKSLGYA